MGALRFDFYSYFFKVVAQNRMKAVSYVVVNNHDDFKNLLVDIEKASLGSRSVMYW